jgi:hypothetical protein
MHLNDALLQALILLIVLALRTLPPSVIPAFGDREHSAELAKAVLSLLADAVNRLKSLP